MKGAKDTKTVIFPNTIRETSEEAFSKASVQSAGLNERLETIKSELFYGSKSKGIN